MLPPASFIAGRHILLLVGAVFGQDGIFGRPITVQLLFEIFLGSCIAVPFPPYTCMEGSPSIVACLVSFTRHKAYIERVSLLAKEVRLFGYFGELRQPLLGF